MKYMIISDIHGSETHLQHMLQIFEEKQYDFLVVLGDILYHGPRNPLPEGHNPQGVVKLLNAYASKIIACRGNCDAEVDQMLLDFPCLSDYTLIVDDGIRLFATHGHIYHPENIPPAKGKNIFLYGHTHLWELKQHGNTLICNPGSISLPKENRPHTYAVYENTILSIYTRDQELLASCTLSE
ncbi:phosphodiesterase [Cellulosilyticum sp. I15G10I2]|uniref:phosphodiesterase n=1 Tax=Cellulosilyticum sp. I15G10I2 TaxID=1892843 RepID=UPI00085C0BFC|nr:phosphodiesterase [Cellulosilyticum sp. I15G10I2]